MRPKKRKLRALVERWREEAERASCLQGGVYDTCAEELEELYDTGEVEAQADGAFGCGCGATVWPLLAERLGWVGGFCGACVERRAAGS